MDRVNRSESISIQGREGGSTSMLQEKPEGNIITVKTDGVEKAGILMRVITENVNFKKKFQMTIEYDPKLPNAKIKYEEINNE